MTKPNGSRGRSAKDWTAPDEERLRELWVKGMSPGGDRNRTQSYCGGDPISRLAPEPPGMEARSFANWDMGKKARAEGEEMSEKTESFDAFLSRWINERIQKLGADVGPADREGIVEKKTAELVALSGNFAGFHAKLDEVALPYGGVKEYVRHLYRLADARGSTTRPTAHDGADD